MQICDLLSYKALILFEITTMNVDRYKFKDWTPGLFNIKGEVIQARTPKTDWKGAVSEAGGIQARKLFHVGGAINYVKRENWMLAT